MNHNEEFYIGGEWVAPLAAQPFDVINPATEEACARISLGSAADVDRAVSAARRAFPAFAATSREARLALLERIVALCEARSEALAQAMTMEIGSPLAFSRQTQVANTTANFIEMIRVLRDYPFDYRLDDTVTISREPIGVCGLITPWNWPLSQITSKLAPALAAGCTVVLKPSEIAPLSSILLADIVHDAGVPPGVFNLVNGDGATVGAAIAGHADIDMVSFTGSTLAGVRVAIAAAPSVKRVTQELGGKSPNIVLDDADLEVAIPSGIARCFTNTGQSCQAPTRMLIPRARRDAVIELARAAVARIRVGDPLDMATSMGPSASRAQFDKVQRLIETGIAEGASLVAGGPGRPEGLNRGYYVRPTIFADVTPEMTIAREEIFGPVLSILSYDSEDEAVSIANDTVYGLAGYVQGRDVARARRVAGRLRAGRIYVNEAAAAQSAPFGGYKRSGNGREKGVFGLEEYLEIKAVLV